jgi:hypothetical protein
MKKIFRNKFAQRYFEHFKNDSYTNECGVDNHGMIYVSWLNGNVERYSRRDFIKSAKVYYSKETELINKF